MRRDWQSGSDDGSIEEKFVRKGEGADVQRGRDRKGDLEIRHRSALEHAFLKEGEYVVHLPEALPYQAACDGLV